MIPADSYFVLGDGEKSYDSRYWGFVKKIMGSRTWVSFALAVALLFLVSIAGGVAKVLREGSREFTENSMR